MREGTNGERVGEASNLGPYEYGGATSGSMGSAAVVDLGGIGAKVEAWWDDHGMGVQESWAMMREAGMGGCTRCPSPQDRAKQWDDYVAGVGLGQGFPPSHGMANPEWSCEGFGGGGDESVIAEPWGCPPMECELDIARHCMDVDRRDGEYQASGGGGPQDGVTCAAHFILAKEFRGVEAGFVFKKREQRYRLLQ